MLLFIFIAEIFYYISCRYATFILSSFWACAFAIAIVYAMVSWICDNFFASTRSVNTCSGVVVIVAEVVAIVVDVVVLSTTFLQWNTFCSKILAVPWPSHRNVKKEREKNMFLLPLLFMRKRMKMAIRRIYFFPMASNKVFFSANRKHRIEKPEE